MNNKKDKEYLIMKKIVRAYDIFYSSEEKTTEAYSKYIKARENKSVYFDEVNKLYYNYINKYNNNNYCSEAKTRIINLIKENQSLSNFKKFNRNEVFEKFNFINDIDKLFKD